MSKARAALLPDLQRFELEDLASFTKDGTFSTNASCDFRIFHLGRCDVHGILRHLLSRATQSLNLNRFVYDDEELNAECMRCAMDVSVTTVVMLDESRAGGKHERAILDTDTARDPVTFNTHVLPVPTYPKAGRAPPLSGSLSDQTQRLTAIERVARARVEADLRARRRGVDDVDEPLEEPELRRGYPHPRRWTQSHGRSASERSATV